MKKNMKSVLSMILALCMVACMALPAFAENDNVIIINQNSNTVSNSQQSSQPTPPPAPKKKSNYDYAVLTGNEGTYKQDVSAAARNIYEDPFALSEKPDPGHVDLKVFCVGYGSNGLNVYVNVTNGLEDSITVKRFDHLLITLNGKTLAKVPYQMVTSTKIKAGKSDTVWCNIEDPACFDHNAKLNGLNATYSIEADIIYD